MFCVWIFLMFLDLKRPLWYNTRMETPNFVLTRRHASCMDYNTFNFRGGQSTRNVPHIMVCIRLCNQSSRADSMHERSFGTLKSTRSGLWDLFSATKSSVNLRLLLPTCFSPSTLEFLLHFFVACPWMSKRKKKPSDDCQDPTWSNNSNLLDPPPNYASLQELKVISLLNQCLNDLINSLIN